MTAPRYRCATCGTRVQCRIAFSDIVARAIPFKHNDPKTGDKCPGYDAVETT